MRLKTVYIYPDRTYSTYPDANPYREDLAKGLSDAGINVIRSRTAWLGTMDFFLYMWKMDFIVFNWIEEVANRTMGGIQTVAFLLVLPLLKIFKVKIVWTVHNKVGHNKKNVRIAGKIRIIMAKKADLIISHTQHGLDELPSPDKKKKHYPHPFKIAINEPYNDHAPIVDLLLWGKLAPYKGILEFLQYLDDKGLKHRFSISVQGECNDVVYLQKIKNFECQNIEIHNTYLSSADLSAMMHKAKIIVFTHKAGSVLSSGALVESLGHLKTIIGPAIGNFNDFKSEGIIYTYNGFDELVTIADELIKGTLPLINPNEIKKFMAPYSWKSYAKFILHELYV